MIQNTSNYGKARQYYQKASHIDTRNAKPFNQLAILAWTAKRKFEAVYYHMRCLQTKSPVESSRQSLIEIFEDIRKRWEISEKKRLEERAQRKKEADSERDRMHLIILQLYSTHNCSATSLHHWFPYVSILPVFLSNG